MQTQDYGLIFDYGVQMTIVFAAGIALWTLIAWNKDSLNWFRVNAVRLGMALANFWLISAGLVLVPNFANLFGVLGFNADQSPVGIAIVIILTVIKTEDKPAVTVTDPIPNGD